MRSRLFIVPAAFLTVALAQAPQPAAVDFSGAYSRPYQLPEVAAMPSMPLQPADNNGYLSAKATHANYVPLLERVNEQDVGNSKALRKPLNVQSGQDDGHQGGRRFRRWVLDAVALKRGRK